MSENDEPQENLELFDEELAQLDALSSMFDELDSTLNESNQEEQLSNKENTETSEALEKCPKDFLPGENIVCKNCPHAKWYGNDLSLKCYCRDMFQLVYDSEHTEDAIHYCDRPQVQPDNFAGEIN